MASGGKRTNKEILKGLRRHQGPMERPTFANDGAGEPAPRGKARGDPLRTEGKASHSARRPLAGRRESESETSHAPSPPTALHPAQVGAKGSRGSGRTARPRESG